MNNNPAIAKVALPLPIDRLFDYHIPNKLRGNIKTGMRVKVLFNNKVVFGFVAGLCEYSKIKKLNPVISLLDNFPLITDLNLKLAKKIQEYYACSLGEAIACMLPYHFKNTKEAELDYLSSTKCSKDKAGKSIIYVQDSNRDKTLAYFKDEIIRRVRDKEKVIFLVPEIQMIERIKEKLSSGADINIAAWHGRLTRKEVLNLWSNLSQGKIDVVIGTRSAALIPVNNLGLIILDNEGDYAYKEDQVPYYEALNMARMRAQVQKCDIILASAVPSLEVYKLIADKNVAFKKIAEGSIFTKIQLARINYKDRIDFMLENEIASALEKKQKVLIFLNRKGFATFIYCSNCKEVLRCSRCSSNLRFEYSKKALICPSCDQEIEEAQICPKCNSAYVKYGGLGIEKLESNLKRIFPQARISKFEEGKHNQERYDILLATSKVLNSVAINPDITIVWNLDNMLNMGDFNSCEDLFRSLARLSSFTKDKMIISTSLNPDFYLLNNLRSVDFEQFYDKELSTRRELKLPPFYQLARVSIRGLNKESVSKACSRLHAFLEKNKPGQVVVSSPDTRLRERIRGKYYKYLLIKSKNIKLLNTTLKKAL
ncbi:MAG: primosomal protein N', partial [Candidatus Omnitrophica bacterium]|nr:primosomal protein N' [Candidatus Omnitrophota bacterium]